MAWVEITGLEDKKLRLRWVDGKLTDEEAAMVRAYWESMYSDASVTMTKRAYGLAGFLLALVLVLIGIKVGVL